MVKRLLLVPAGVLALSLTGFAQCPDAPKGKQETVESVRARWVEEFKKDPSGKIEVFHVGGRKTIIGQENYVIGLTQAAFETGHPIYFTQGEEDLSDTEKKSSGQ
jgi:hypothetical protein